MSLRDELLGTAAPTPRGYTLLVPPDWGQFPADDAGRDALVALLRARFAEVQRPDLFAQVRSAVQQQWDQLRSQGAIEIYMPVIPPTEGGTPMTVVTVPWIAQGPFDEDVRARAGAASGYEVLDAGDGTVVHRWENERAGQGATEGVFAREITYVRPFPGDSPQRGVMLMASIVHPGAELAGPALDGFTALADAVASTFVWRFA